MYSALLVTLLALPGIEVQVKPLSGPVVTGALVSLSPETLVLKAGEAEKSLAVKQLLSVNRAGALVTKETAKVWVDLVDGSELLAARYVATQNKATVTLLGGVEVEIPTRSIRSVRLHPADPALQKQWTEIVEGKITGDTLIKRQLSTVKVEGDEKTGDKTQPQIALDSLEGVIKDVTADVVQFVYDGDALDVRREKIEGFVYYHAVARELPAAVCRVTDAAGSRWQARSVALAGEQFEVASVSGVKLNLPLAQFATLDFSAGNTVFLSELKPDTVEFTPPLDHSKTAGRLAKFYQPRESRRLEGGSPPVVDGLPREKWVALHSRTLLAYRLPAKSQSFEALAVLDETAGEQCRVRLVITGDNKPLFSEVITGADKAREIKVDVTGVRRLTILVDWVDDLLTVSSQLNLIEARITK